MRLSELSRDEGEDEDKAPKILMTDSETSGKARTCELHCCLPVFSHASV